MVAFFGAMVGRIEQVQIFALEMGGGQAVGDQNHVAVGRVLGGQHLPGELQAVLDIGEVLRQKKFAYVRIAHVGPQADDRIADRDRLGHKLDDLARMPGLGDGIDFDELQEIARIFAADQSVQGQAHAFDVDVQAVVTHRTAHVQQHHGGALWACCACDGSRYRRALAG